MVSVRISALIFLLCLAGVAQNVSTTVPTALNGTVTCNGTCIIGPQLAGATLLTIEVSPPSPISQVGQSVTFTATGTYSDGSTKDVTGSASWSVTGSAATNVNNILTCNSAGTAIANASLTGIVGQSTLTCQALQVSPGGNLFATQGQVFSQLFTASGGTAPYTFTLVGQPGWISLSNDGCDPKQINCNLTGTPTSVTTYTFSITATDAIANVLSVAITLQVQAPLSGEDETYCTKGPLHKEVQGVTTYAGQKDGPANLPLKCVWDAIADTPATGPILTVCHSDQRDPADGTTIIPQCASADRKTYFNTISDATQHATCGNRIQIYANQYSVVGGQIVATQYPYREFVNVQNQAGTPISCGPADANGQWLWYSPIAADYAKLPAPGVRVTPAWAGQTSLPGRPPYPGPATPGNYMVAVSPPLCNNGASCPAWSITLPGTSGIRVMGLEFYEQKNFSTPGVPGTAPGFSPSLVQNDCPPSGCGNTGWNSIIYDRILIHACQDKSDVTCTDQMPFALTMQNGNYGAVINSYIYGVKTLGDNHGQISPTDEGHALSGGNVQTNVIDGPLSFRNLFLEAAAETWFFGGAKSNANLYAADALLRKIHGFKPINWLRGTACPPDESYCIGFQGGSLFDAWIANNGGSGYDPTHAACLMDASDSGDPADNAQCGLTVGSGKISSVYAVKPGRKYTRANQHLNACRYVQNGVCITPAAPQLSFAQGVGSLTPGDYLVSISFTFNGSLETDFGTSTIKTAICSGGCAVTVAGPTVPAGFTSYNVYSCAIAAGAKNCTPKLNAAHIGSAINYEIDTAGAGATHSDANLFGEDGIYIVKNLGELKNGVRFHFEGIVSENNNIGQADQFGKCWLFTPKNANNGCPTCQVVDIVHRGNICRHSVSGFGIGADPATQCPDGSVCLPGPVGPISIHDDILELNGSYWITDTSQFNAASGNGFKLSNNNDDGSPCGNGICPTNNVKINHVTVIHTEQQAPPQQAIFGAGLNLSTNCGGAGSANAVWSGITVENSIFSMGFMNTSSQSNGCFTCSKNACGSRNTLDSLLTSSKLLPLNGGNTAYTKNIVMGIILTSAGTCQNHTLTACSITSASGSGATCGLNFNKKTGSLQVFPTAVGSGYSTGDAAIAWTGCDGAGDVLPTATVTLGGAGNPAPSGSWCADHNLNLQNAFVGENVGANDMPIAGITTQGDSSHNSCVGAGGNQDVTGPSQTSLVTPWSAIGFVNFPIDGNGAEIPTGDLHLTNASPGHNAGNGDNRGDVGPFANDLGADFDLVLQYTGCTVQNGVTVCPP